MEQHRRLPPAVQIVGYKKTGKTTLVCRLVEHLSSIGLKVTTVKHDAHGFDADVPGTDSWKHRQAGAAATAIVSGERTAFFEEKETPLEELLLRMADADLVLVEGFKRERFPKLALIHSAEQAELLDRLESVIGVVTWSSERFATRNELPVYAFDDMEAIVSAVLELCEHRLDI